MNTQNNLMHSDDGNISKEALQNASAILALLHGKSDSICRLFRKEISVDKSALSSLNEQILEKLSIHPNCSVTTSVDVTLSNKRILTFDKWADFENYDFSKETSSTKVVFIQWDFLLQLEHYKIPQRHTVNVRISSTPNPSDFFRALLSGGFDENDDFDIQSSTMVCRVDFVNHTLAEELINITEKWNDLCEKAASDVRKINKFAFKHRSLLASIFEMLFQVASAALLGSMIKILINQNVVNLSLELVLYGCVAAFPYFRITRFISRELGQKLYDAFSRALDMRIFKLTRGDERELEKTKKNNAIGKEIAWFVINLIASVAISALFFIIE